MKTRPIAPILLSLALAGGCFCPDIPAAELQDATVIATYEFETPSSIASWREEKKPGEAPSIMALDAEHPYAGKFSFKFGADQDASAVRLAYSRLALPKPAASSRVAIEFYGRTTPDLSCKASLRILEFSQGKPVGWAGNVMDMLVLDKGHDWTLYRAEVALRENTDTLFLYPALSKPKAGEALWIDNLTVTLSR